MQKLVPLLKQSKKKQKQFYSSKRGSWHGINPVTRVVPDKTKYNRKKLSKKFDSFNICTFYKFETFLTLF